MRAWLMPSPPVSPPDSFGPLGPGADDRLAPLCASLAARLGGVCRGWDAADFDTLVERIARRKLHWADQGYDGA